MPARAERTEMRWGERTGLQTLAEILPGVLERYGLAEGSEPCEERVPTPTFALHAVGVADAVLAY